MPEFSAYTGRPGTEWGSRFWRGGSPRRGGDLSVAEIPTLHLGLDLTCTFWLSSTQRMKGFANPNPVLARSCYFMICFPFNVKAAKVQGAALLLIFRLQFQRSLGLFVFCRQDFNRNLGRKSSEQPCTRLRILRTLPCHWNQLTKQSFVSRLVRL